MRLALAALAALLLAGCGGSDPKTDKPAPVPTKAPAKKGKPTILNTGKVERAIVASIAKQRRLKAKVVCPSGVTQQKGLEFACLAVYKGGSTTFSVDQIDDKGHVKYVGQ